MTSSVGFGFTTSLILTSEISGQVNIYAKSENSEYIYIETRTVRVGENYIEFSTSILQEQPSSIMIESTEDEFIYSEHSVQVIGGANA